MWVFAWGLVVRDSLPRECGRQGQSVRVLGGDRTTMSSAALLILARKLTDTTDGLVDRFKPLLFFSSQLRKRKIFLRSFRILFAASTGSSGARRHRFDIVFVAAFDRIARNVRHFLEVLDELNHLGIEFISLRENIDTGGPLGRAMVVIVGAIAELERSLIVERVKAGMRRARLEGRQIGRKPLSIDRDQVIADRCAGMSLTQVSKKHRISRASVVRFVKEAKNRQAVVAA
jgi:hypothetical protein